MTNTADVRCIITQLSTAVTEAPHSNKKKMEKPTKRIRLEKDGHAHSSNSKQDKMVKKKSSELETASRSRQLDKDAREDILNSESVNDKTECSDEGQNQVTKPDTKDGETDQKETSPGPGDWSWADDMEVSELADSVPQKHSRQQEGQKSKRDSKESQRVSKKGGGNKSKKGRSPRGSSQGNAHESTKVTSDSDEVFTMFSGWQNPFSQHHPAKFEVEGIEYNCAEQYMMRMKAVLFKDSVMEKQIMSTDDPKKQKRFGRKVKNFDQDKWEKECWEIVETANTAKFSQNEDLKKVIFDTAGTTLVEAAPWDRRWGIGLRATDPKAKNRHTWKGQNRLGKIITKVRDQLMAKDASTPSVSTK